MAESAEGLLYSSDKSSQQHPGARTTPETTVTPALESGKVLFFPGMQEIGDTPNAPLGRTPTIMVASRKVLIPKPQVVHNLPCISKPSSIAWSIVVKRERSLFLFTGHRCGGRGAAANPCSRRSATSAAIRDNLVSEKSELRS